MEEGEQAVGGVRVRHLHTPQWDSRERWRAEMCIWGLLAWKGHGPEETLKGNYAEHKSRNPKAQSNLKVKNTM